MGLFKNDAWEMKFGLLPLKKDSYLDHDYDGITNLKEYYANTDPSDPTDPKDPSSNEERSILPLLIPFIAIFVVVILVSYILFSHLRKHKRKHPEMMMAEENDP